MILAVGNTVKNILKIIPILAILIYISSMIMVFLVPEIIYKIVLYCFKQLDCLPHIILIPLLFLNFKSIFKLFNKDNNEKNEYWSSVLSSIVTLFITSFITFSEKISLIKYDEKFLYFSKDLKFPKKILFKNYLLPKCLWDLAIFLPKLIKWTSDVLQILFILKLTRNSLESELLFNDITLILIQKQYFNSDVKKYDIAIYYFSAFIILHLLFHYFADKIS